MNNTEILELLSKVTNKKNSIYPRRLIQESNYFGKYKILKLDYKERKSDNKFRYFYLIEFINTGYRTIVDDKAIRFNGVKDLMVPNVHGVGFLGEDYDKIRSEDKELFLVLYNRWYNIINRCYNKKHKSYNRYGDIGVTLCERWHNFSNFYKDVQELENYDRKLLILNKITLDKDKYQHELKENKTYSPETCIWLSRKEQQSLIDHVAKTKAQQKTFKWEDPDGNTGIATGYGKFAREHRLDDNGIRRCIKGKYPSYKGWKFYPVTE